jgi:hypothetical protein
MYRETYRTAPRFSWQADDPVFATSPRGDFRNCPSQAIRPWAAMLADVVERIRSVTAVAPLAVDLARPEFGIPVVFVVAPGLGFRAPQRS